jgi:hypothetical protein
LVKVENLPFAAVSRQKRHLEIWPSDCFSRKRRFDGARDETISAAVARLRI